MVVLSKKKVEQSGGKPRLEKILKHIKILEHLNHPNIIKLDEAFYDEKKIYMVYEMLKSTKRLPTIVTADFERRQIARDLILATEYIHYKGIVHEHLQPRHLRLDENNIVRIINFEGCREFEGTEANGKAIDVWSLGSILYSLCYRPGEKHVHFPKPHPHANVPLILENLLRKMLESNPSKRITIEQIKMHNWVTDFGREPMPSLEENCVGRRAWNSAAVLPKTIDLTTDEYRYISGYVKADAQTPLHERHSFVPYISGKEKQNGSTDLTPAHILRLYTHLVIENCPQAFDIKVMEYGGNKKPESLHALQIMKDIESVPLSKLEADVTIVANNMEGVDPSFAQNGIKFSKDVTGKDYNFVVAENFATDQKMINNFIDILSPGGFILLQESPDASFDFGNFNLQLISNIVTENSSYLFLRKPTKEVNAVYIRIDKSLQWVEIVKSAIKSATEQNEKVILVSQGEPDFGVLGFINCLKIEPGGNNVRCVFVQDDSAPEFSESNQFYGSQLKKDLLMNVYKNGEWGAYRHLIIPSEKENKIVTPYAYVNTTMKGDLSSLQWIQEAPPEYRPEYGSKKLCYVYYATLTENDVLMVSLKGSKYISPRGLRNGEEYIGMEFSGKDTNGKRVMGVVSDKALATTVFADDDLLWEVPEDLTLEQASTIPVPYSTAYYALIVKGKVKSGETVLIHEATSPLANAAINICLKAGCQVLATTKSEFFLYLSNLYPKLPPENVVDPSKVSVEYVIMERTNCKGVDVIFNTLGSHQMRHYCPHLTKRGRFLDIRKPDVANPAVGTDFLSKETVYYAIYPESFFMEGGVAKEDKQKVSKLVNEGLKDGTVVPSMTTPIAEIDKAFSTVSEGNYLGKVCVEVKEEEEEEENAELKPASIPASRRAYFDPKKSYIVLGGLGGFGCELIRWMCLAHAKNVIAVSRSGFRTAGQKYSARTYRKLGGNLIVSTADCSTLAGAEEVIKTAKAYGPVGGIFNLAAILKDSLFENSTVETFEEVCKPKVKATHNMDILSRKLCSELDYFVAFSSISCGRGNAGQTNYGMANSAMDRICEARLAAGYPAISIQWGAIGDVGMILDRMLMENDGAAGGIVPQKLKCCLSTLDYFLGLEYPVLATTVLEQKTKSVGGDVQLKPADVVANILGIRDVGSVSKSATLVELGTDSLTNIEIKQTLERKFDIVLSAQEILQLTFQKLEQS